MSVQSLKLSQTSMMPKALIALIAVLVGLAAFGGSLLELVHRWIAQEEYSHGFLIPVVTAWLLWNRRDAFIASICRPALAGPRLVLIALASHLFGGFSGIFFLSP